MITTKQVLRLGCAGMLGGGLAILLVVGGIIFFGPNRIPLLTEESLKKATARWENANVVDYEMDVQLGGVRTEKYHVVVVGGFAESATLDGRPLTESRLMEPWTIAGMLQTAKTDLEIRRRAAAGEGVRDLFLRTEFSEQHGIPLRYVRVESGTSYELTWEIQNFTIPSASD